MDRAKISDHAKILVELGKTRPLEMGFDPFGPFKILWVITNGVFLRNFIWVKVLKTGIYVALGVPGGSHTSYHTDGTFHWKTNGRTVLKDRRHPLPDIPEPVLIQNGTTSLDNETLDGFELTEFGNQPVDRVVYLDNRMLPDWVWHQVWAVPPFRHGDVPLLTDHPAHIHLITHTNPWIQVVIYEPEKRGQ
jgi:hypothetical protein